MNTHRGAVVVGYDGSADSDLALSWADQYAHDHRRALHVVISEVDATQVLEVTSDWHAARMAQLESDARDRLKSARAPGTGLSISKAPPAPALIEASKEAALLVLGARGHSLVSGIVLGSVSQHVTRHAACPVVVTRHPNNPDSRRIVVGVDGSPEGAKALEFAFEHASHTGGALTVIFAWRSLSRGTHGGLGVPDQTYADESAEAERLLAEAIAGMSERYPDVTVVPEPIPVAPSRALADASESAALVVVGSRGRGAFAGLLLGSVSQSVLNNAGCSVAVVR
ncbi:MAG TPA: universal stress protein [Nocardioidaceae bacterium]|nr:universal stress protein [Nocardioidaceae bacterium]